MSKKSFKNPSKDVSISNNFMHQWVQGSEGNSSWLLWNRISMIKSDSSKEGSSEKHGRHPIDYSNEKYSKALNSKLLNVHCSQNIKSTSSTTTKAKSRNIQVIKNNTWK